MGFMGCSDESEGVSSASLCLFVSPSSAAAFRIILFSLSPDKFLLAHNHPLLLATASSPLAGALLKVLVIYNLVHERRAPDSKWIMDQSIVPYRAWFFRSSSFIRCRCLRTINSRISGCAFYKYSPKLHRTANEENRWLTASRSFSRYMVFFYLCLVVVRRAAAGLWGWFMFGIMLLARNYEGTWNY